MHDNVSIANQIKKKMGKKRKAEIGEIIAVLEAIIRLEAESYLNADSPSPLMKLAIQSDGVYMKLKKKADK